MNSYYLPMMFCTTWILNMVYFPMLKFRPDIANYIHTPFEGLDALCNNICMFYSLYRNSDWKKIDFEVVNDLVYVSLPGFHIFQIRQSIVEKCGLRAYVVNDRALLKQIKYCERRPCVFVPSLLCVCRTANEVENELRRQIDESTYYE